MCGNDEQQFGVGDRIGALLCALCFGVLPDLCRTFWKSAARYGKEMIILATMTMAGE